MKLLRLILMIGLVLGVGTLVHAQEPWRGDYGQSSADRAYNDGFLQGQRDRSYHSRYAYKTPQWKSGDRYYRDAYHNGYDQGYNTSNGSRYYTEQRGPAYSEAYGRDRGYGANGTSRYAYDRGYQDGRRDGEKDVATRHSFRPTKSDNYEDGDRGYNSSFGDKRYYKEEYRAGYVQGYQEGYSQRGYGSRR